MVYGSNYVVLFWDEQSSGQDNFRFFSSLKDAEIFISYLYECWEAYPMNGEAFLFRECDPCG